MTAATIFALASAPGRAAVSVVRLSGHNAAEASGRIGASVPLDRRMRLRKLIDPATGDTLDEALVVGFARGASFTGEPTVELHLHGSPAVLRAVLRVLRDDPQLEPAQAGAFTRQALENGRLTLPQVEALADLIDAEGEAQRQQALAGLGGALVKAAERWRSRLVDARALIEAGIDFADEGIADGTLDAGLALAAAVRDEIAADLAGAEAAVAIRNGFTVALIGPPNAGKSSLINALSRRDVAIVTELPGTTRDVLEVRCEVAGQVVTLLDTAGLRDSDDKIEQLGIARARARAEAADLRLHVSAPGLPAPLHGWRDGDIHVANKADIGKAAGLAVSAMTGEGLDHLLAAIGNVVTERVAGAGLAAHARQDFALRQAMQALAVPPSPSPEIAAEHVRTATAALDGLVGRVDVEEVLGAIFARFCIGK